MVSKEEMTLYQTEEYEALIRTIGESHVQLCAEAYAHYRPIAYELCSRATSENEVEHTLDWMLGFCGCEEMLELFKMICRKYIYVFPQMIEFEIRQYHDMFERDAAIQQE